MDHTQACLDASARHADATLAFRKRYPHACTICRGWGYTAYSYDPSPAGVSLSSGSFTMTDPCPACEGHDDAPTCALCGQLLADDARTCACPPDGGLEEGPECFCWYEQEQRAHVVSVEGDTIRSGHGVVEAARTLGLTHLVVERAPDAPHARDELERL